MAMPGGIASHWVPTPQRRVLLEHAAFIYAFGNTKHTSLFRDNQQQACKLLLLGFGDVRHVLATAAACAAQPATKCRRLTFHLNDIGPLNVARGILLLHLADSIDPGVPEDLDFFWGVAYCLQLPGEHAERLAAAVRHLLAQRGSWTQRFGDAGEARRIERVMRGWLQPAPPVAAVLEERRRLQMARISQRVDRPIGTAAELAGAHRMFAGALLVGLLPFPFEGRGSVKEHVLSEALLEEFAEFLDAGSIYRTAVGTTRGGGGAWGVNPTLLAPGTRRWQLHYSSCPFRSFIPLDPAKHAAIGAAGQPREVTEACLSDLQALLQGYQACRASRQVEVHFSCCNALALCSRLRAQQQQQEEEEGQQQVTGVRSLPSGSAPGSSGFDVVDTSNLPDHVGLLNVLSLAGPLLRRTQHARLFTGHMLWSTGARTLHEYVRLACGADPQLFPTLLGLRLMNDPLYGLALPHNPMTSYGQTDVQDVLEWMPAGIEPAAQPTATGSDGISAALVAWGDLCTRQSNIPLDRSGLRFGSLLTLLHLVAGAARRVQPLLPPGGAPQQQPAWRQLAASLAAACSLDEVFTLQLRALCCWALQQPGQAPPLLVSGRVPLSAAYKELAREGRTPLLGVHLVSLPSRPTIQHLLATAQRAAAGSQQGSHLLDVLGFDVETAELSFLLPPDHGLGVEGSLLTIFDSAGGAKLTAGPVPLASFAITPYTVSPPAALAAGLRRLLQQAGGEPVVAAGSVEGAREAVHGGGVELSRGLALRKLAEHADRFEVELVVEEKLGGTVSSSGLQLEFPGGTPGGGSCHSFQLTLAQPAGLRACISLPWPVDSLTASIKVRRSARTIAATLGKHPLWLRDRAWLPKLDVDGLPAWGRGKDASSALSCFMSCMFSHAEMGAKTQGVTLGGGGLHVMYDVKESLQALFVRTYEGAVMHMLHSTAARDPNEAALFLVVHGGVRRLPDGRPLLHVSYVDHAAAERMYPTERSQQEPVRRFSKIMRSVVGARGPSNTINCTPDELRLLRFLLARNAASLRVPRWQASLLELPSDWEASFVVPAFSDFVAEGDQGAALIGQLPSLTARMKGLDTGEGEVAGGSAGQGGAAQAAATQHKEAGNALFKQRRYGAAVQRYQQGVETLQAVLAAGPAGGSAGQRQLLTDLLNNLGLTLVRQAEAEPAEAARCLAAAEAACTAALQLDGSNSKALYRRALALHKQGKTAAAQRDLSRLGSDAGDAAVEALRRQVRAARGPTGGQQA